MDWKKYENEIYEHFRAEFPSAKITRDAKIVGRYSKVERQIDVLIEEMVAGFEVRIAIDAKYRDKRVDVKEVEAFVAYCADIGAHKGVMISLMGYSKAAANRAHYGDIDVELDILNFADLKQFQGFEAIPYAGGYGVVLPAPFGWIVDATRREGMIAALYQRGYDFDQAGRAHEFMYVNLWNKDHAISDLDGLTAFQDSLLRQDRPNAKITYQDGPKREKGVTTIRCFVDASYPTPEYTGFMDFDGFIFFCVMFSPAEVVNRNLRKLNYILRSVLPIRVREDEGGLLKALELKPWDRSAFIRLIDLYRRDKRIDAYKKAVKDFIALDYGNTYTFSIYVDYLAQKKMNDADRHIARELAEQEFSGPQEIGAVFYNLGHVAEMGGGKDLALQHYTKSLKALKELEAPPEGSIDALTQLIANLNPK